MSGPADETTEPAERSAFVIGRRGVHRRPSGEPPPLPRSPWWPRALAALVFVVALGIVLKLLFEANPPSGSLALFESLQTNAVLVAITKVFNWFASNTGILLLRVVMAVVLIRYARLRHLAIAIAALWLMDVAVTALQFQLRAPTTNVLVEPASGNWCFPASAIASLSVTLGVMAMSMAPAGRVRWQAFVWSGLFAVLVVLARAILGATYPAAGLYSVLLGFTVAIVAFGWLAPDDAFPVSYAKGGNAAHLDLAGARTTAVVRAVKDQLGLDVVGVKAFGEEGSGGSTPLLMTLDDGRHVFGKILATSHVSSDRWYRIIRTIMYGRLEDETSFSSVRQLIGAEDYALRLLDDQGFRVAHTYGIVEITPNREYLLVEEFFDGAGTLGHAEVTDAVIDEAIQLVRRLWDAGLAHRDLKPANLLVVDGHLQLIDVSGLEVRPSPWRQAVDLANMMLVMALRTDAPRVYEASQRSFTPDDVAEAFAAAQGMAIPTELQRFLQEDPRDLLAEFRGLAPARPRISIQRWSVRRIALTLAVAGGTLVLAAWSISILFTVLD
jgi:hypothetical protein